jgi:hypothetical protein
MYPNLSSEPILGIVAIVLVLVCLFVFTGINMSDLFTTEGFTKIYNEKPWIIYLGVGLTLYALLSIWTSHRARINQPGALERMENVDSTVENLMTFDNFFRKYFVSEPEAPGDIPLSQPNVYMILRTNVNGQNYYMVMKNDTNASVYSHIHPNTNRGEIMPRACKFSVQDTDHYIAPVLMREDALDTAYDSFWNEFTGYHQALVSQQESQDAQDSAKVAMGSDSGSIPESLVFNSVDLSSDTFDGTIGGIINTKGRFVDHVETFLPNLSDALTQEKKKYYPRFIHHLSAAYQLKLTGSEKPDPNAPKTPAYVIRGMHRDQVINKDLTQIELETPYIVTTNKTLWQSETMKNSDDALFLCGTHQPAGTSPTGRNYFPDAIYSESWAPILENVQIKSDSSEDSASDDMSESKVISNPSIIDSHEKLASRVNLYFYKDGVKYYIARLNGFKRRDEQPQTQDAASADSTASSVSSVSSVSSASSTTNADGTQDVDQSPMIIPIGMVPETYVKPTPDEFPSIDQPDFSLAEKIDFDVFMVKILPLSGGNN